MEDFFIVIDEDASDIFYDLWENLPKVGSKKQTPIYYYKEVINEVSWICFSNAPITHKRVMVYFKTLE